MAGQSFGDAARSRHCIDVDVAVVFTGEGYSITIRREARGRLYSDPGGQTARLAAVTRYDPEISRIGEDDMSPAECGVAHQQRLLRLGGAGTGIDACDCE